jgi:hypothetical protein
MQTEFNGPQLPWWRVPVVWLALAGPAVVVVAGIATAVLALQGADTPVQEPATAVQAAHAPALPARNHAATPGR